VADGGYQWLQFVWYWRDEIDFFARPTGSSIDPAFSHEAFTYEATTNYYICPPGSKLTYQR